MEGDKSKSKTKKNENNSSDEEIDIKKPSYTYWKRESDQPFSNDFKPQKSDPVVVSSDTTISTNNYGSAWNKAGTWEEKHLTKNQLEDYFNQSIKSKTLAIKDCCTVDNISSYSGDVII
jgi:hypothetical protein